MTCNTTLCDSQRVKNKRTRDEIRFAKKKKKQKTKRDSDDSPFAVLILVRVRLNAVLLDQKFDALVEGGGDRWRLFAQQNVDGIVGRETHDVLGAHRMLAALAI